MYAKVNPNPLFFNTSLQNLSSVGITFAPGGQMEYEGTDRLLENVVNLSSSLHTLVLGLNMKFDSASPILALEFPNLRYLHLGLFTPETAEAMAFWIKHPMLETLKLSDTDSQSKWFDETVPEDILPNLKYLEVSLLKLAKSTVLPSTSQTSFRDAVSLIPILPRLTGLAIHQSINAQVPYLIRELIPGGLPNLRSFEIDQEWSGDRQVLRSHKGSLWYETPGGKFAQQKNFSKAARNFTDGYLSSVVLGAPNIEELCLHGMNLHPNSAVRLPYS